MVVVLAVLRDTDPFQYWKEACLDEKEAQVVFVMVQFCSIGKQLRLLFIHEAEGVFFVPRTVVQLPLFWVPPFQPNCDLDHSRVFLLTWKFVFILQ